MLKHGTAKNVRKVTTTHEEVVLRDENGEIIYSGPVYSIEETVCERWCACCKAWVDSRGIAGNTICLRCHSAWEE